MDRRTLIAVGLMLIVAVLPSILMPPKRPPPGAGLDSIAVVDSAPAALDSARVEPPPAALPKVVQRDSVIPTPEEQELGRVVSVESPLYQLGFSTRGGRLTRAALREYRTFAAGDTGRAEMIPEDSRFLEFRLVVGNDTIPLADWTFEPSVPELRVAGPGADLTFTAQRGVVTVSLTYSFDPERYHFNVTGRVSGVDASGFVLVGLGPRISLVEADSVDDFRNYAVVTKAGKTDKLNFRSLDPGESRELAGPFEWIAVKSKYFVAALLTIEENQLQLGGAVVVGGPKPGRHATSADVWASLPAPGGTFGFSMYVGPQEYRRLVRMGHSLPYANPYGWILRPIIRPFPNLLVVVLLWLHEPLSLGYGRGCSCCSGYSCALCCGRSTRKRCGPAWRCRRCSRN
jgi:YidC/Oxa1 family membrane protein insertase